MNILALCTNAVLPALVPALAKSGETEARITHDRDDAMDALTLAEPLGRAAFEVVIVDLAADDAIGFAEWIRVVGLSVKLIFVAMEIDAGMRVRAADCSPAALLIGEQINEIGRVLRHD